MPLTAVEIQEYNGMLEPVLSHEPGPVSINPLNHFVRVYYDKPEHLNLAKFLRYYPSDKIVTDETEFEALKAHEQWPFGGGADLDSMIVPIHKFYAQTVNNVLKERMDITLENLSVGVDDVIYLQEYDAYYNFTSDAAYGIFVCTKGETQGDIIRLYSDNAELVLRKKGKDFIFVSHLSLYGKGGEDNGVCIGINVENEDLISEAVLDYAREFVGLQVDYYNELGEDADYPDRVVVVGGMKMEEMDGKQWITEWNSPGQPYLLLVRDVDGQETLWQRICVTNTDRITQEYGTPEMLERYGDKFTAAAVELYKGSDVYPGIPD